MNNKYTKPVQRNTDRLSSRQPSLSSRSPILSLGQFGLLHATCWRFWLRMSKIRSRWGWYIAYSGLRSARTYCSTLSDIQSRCLSSRYSYRRARITQGVTPTKMTESDIHTAEVHCSKIFLSSKHCGCERTSQFQRWFKVVGSPNRVLGLVLKLMYLIQCKDDRCRMTRQWNRVNWFQFYSTVDRRGCQ